MTLAEINALRDLDRDALVQRGFDVGLDMTDGAERWPTDDSLRLAIIQKAVGTAVEEAGDEPQFAHLDANSQPSNSAEAFWMAQQWGKRFSHWNTICNYYPTERAGEAMATTAQADAAEAQRLIAIGVGFVLKESLADLLAEGLGGIEDRLSEINDGVRG